MATTLREIGMIGYATDADITFNPPTGVTAGDPIARVDDESGIATRYLRRAVGHNDEPYQGLTFVALDPAGTLMAADGFRMHSVAGAVCQQFWPAGRDFCLIPPLVLRPGLTILATSDPAMLAADYPGLPRCWWRADARFPNPANIALKSVTCEALIADPKVLTARIRRPSTPRVCADDTSANPWLKPEPPDDEPAIVRLGFDTGLTLRRPYRLPEPPITSAQIVRGAPFEITMSPWYLIDALAGIVGPVKLQWGGMPTPVVLTAGRLSATVMPMKRMLDEDPERWPQ